MMASNIFTCLISGSLAGSILFGLLLLLDCVFGKIHVRYIYQFAKIILILYLGSGIAIVYMVFFIGTRYNVLLYKSEDFQYIRQIRGLVLSQFSFASDVISIILLVWLVLFIAVFFLSIIRSFFTIKKQLLITTAVNDTRLLIFNNLKKELNIKRDIGLYEHPTAGFPYLTGIIRPSIILPNGTYSTEEWGMFLRHELLHYKSHDLVYRLIIEVVQKIHWFNPVIYFFSLKVYELSELVCDETAVDGMDITQRAQYARLLNSAACGNGVVKILASFYGNYQRVERRIYNIMEQKKQKISVAFAFAIVLILALCPIVSYASVTAANQAQDLLVHAYMEQNDTVSDDSDVITDFVGNKTDRTTTTFLAKAARGDNTLTNYVSEATNTALFSPVSLSKGDEVIIAVYSNSTNDKYIGGIIDSDGKRTYVHATKGAMTHTFKITKSDIYEVFFQGKNGSGGADITLNGTVSIER